MGKTAWAGWQRDYEHGTLVIWPPDEVRSEINPLRETYSPIAHAYCEAHISLTQPFLREPGEADWQKMKEIVSALAPFTITYGPLRTWSSGRIIFLEIQPVDQLLTVREKLHETGLFNLALPFTDGFVPHMTIQEGYPEGTPGADIVDIERGQEVFATLRAALNGGRFVCKELTWIVPDEQFHFGVIRTLPFTSA